MTYRKDRKSDGWRNGIKKRARYLRRVCEVGRGRAIMQFP